MALRIQRPAASETAPAYDAWTDVLTELTGLRLALYDELHRRGELGPNQLAALLCDPATPLPTRRDAATAGGIEAGLDWLQRHRLAQRGQSGRWRVRSMSEARAAYLEKGEGAADPALAVQVATPSAPATPPPPTAPRRQVHACGLLDLGDY